MIDLLVEYEGLLFVLPYEFLYLSRQPVPIELTTTVPQSCRSLFRRNIPLRLCHHLVPDTSSVMHNPLAALPLTQQETSSPSHSSTTVDKNVYENG